MITPERLSELSDQYDKIIPESKREKWNFAKISEHVAANLEMNTEEAFMLGTALQTQNIDYLNAMLYSTTKLLQQCKHYMTSEGKKLLAKPLNDTDDVMNRIVNVEEAERFIRDEVIKMKYN